MTARRSVKTGLVASAVVSSWTVGATLLTSSTWCYEFGVSGAYFYGAGATIQIFIFSIAAIELKRRAPAAHTFLEVAKIRYGKGGHILFMSYSIFLALVNDSGILVAGSEVFAALTGMNVIAGVWLLPIGVVIYTLTGGIKATILTDYVHIIIIYAMTLAGLFVVYTHSNVLGSPDIVWERLKAAAQTNPVAGNAGGEYLTMRSETGVLLGVLFWCACFGSTVNVQLFQKAIAADPSATMPGYIIGGLAWFAIPFCLATTFGLAGRAMQGFPEMRELTPRELGQGLAMPFAAQALMGSGGAVFVLVAVFMVCTSGFSSDLASLAAIFTYDIYGTYISPTSSGKQLLRMSRLTVLVWSIGVACIATGLTFTTIGVNYLVTFVSIFSSSAVFPFYSTTIWERQNKTAVMVGPILGTCTAAASWFGITYHMYGEITVATTSEVIPLVVGNAVSLVSGAVYSLICTFAFGRDDFDWGLLQTQIKNADDSDVKGYTPEQAALEKAHEVLTPEQDQDLRRGKVKAIIITTILCLIFVVIWPFPMFGTSYVFSKGFFKFWLAITFLWAFAASLTIVFMPLIQGRQTIILFFKTMVLGKKLQPAGRTSSSEDDAVDTVELDASKRSSGEPSQGKGATAEAQLVR